MGKCVSFIPGPLAPSHTEIGNFPQLRPWKRNSVDNKQRLPIPSGDPIGPAVLPSHHLCCWLPRTALSQSFLLRLAPSGRKPSRLMGTSSALLLAVSPSTLALPSFISYAAKPRFAGCPAPRADLPLASCKSSALNWAPTKTRKPVQYSQMLKASATPRLP